MKSIINLLLTLSIISSSFGQADSTDFESLKGKLPVPVKSYNTIENCCIDQFNQRGYLNVSEPVENKLRIICDSNTTTFAWAAGQVQSIFNLSGLWIVILSHGNFFTVFINLENIQIEEGQTINRLQPIGTVASINNQYRLDVELWKKETREGKSTFEKLNPMEWLEIK